MPYYLFIALYLIYVLIILYFTVYIIVYIIQSSSIREKTRRFRRFLWKRFIFVQRSRTRDILSLFAPLLLYSGFESKREYQMQF